MNAKVYIKVAKLSKGLKYEASSKPDNTPIYTKDYRGMKAYPTAFFAIDLRIDESVFHQAENVAGIVYVEPRPGVIEASQG